MPMGHYRDPAVPDTRKQPQRWLRSPPTPADGSDTQQVQQLQRAGAALGVHFKGKRLRAAPQSSLSGASVCSVGFC